MSINIKGLSVAKNDRTLRELISTPQGQIEVYEPSLLDIQKIIDMQREQEFGAQTGSIVFDGLTVVRELYPLLTNIDLGDLSDEELEEVIENPSIHLLIAQQVLAQIVAESNKLYAERIKTEFMNTDSAMAQAELLTAIPAFIVEKAKGDGRIAELVEKAEQASEEVEKALEEAKVEAQI